MRKVAVLGGSGFIGTRMVEHLQRQAVDVVIGDIRKSERYPHLWRNCDVTIPASLPDVLRGTDIIVNLAAEHRDDVRPIGRYHDVNVHGAEVVCDVASDLGIERLIFTSSVAVYGLPQGVVSEDGPCSPFNEYGRTKLLAEGVYKSWCAKSESRSLVIVRPTVVFGESNRGNVYNLLRQISTGRFVMVGDGRNRKSLAYVENMAAFLAHTMRSGAGVHLYNYADGPDFDMRALTSEVAARMGRKLPAFSIPYGAGYALGTALDVASRLTGRSFPLSAVRVKKFCANTQFSAVRAMASGFEPTVSLTEALARVIQSDFPEARQCYYEMLRDLLVSTSGSQRRSGATSGAQCILSEDPDVLATCSFALIYGVGVLSFADARPRSMSGIDFEEQDDWSGTACYGTYSMSMVRAHFYGDYVRGRMRKTSIGSRQNGTIRLGTINRGELALAGAHPKIGRDWIPKGHRRLVVTPGQNKQHFIAGALNAATGKLTRAASMTSALFCTLFRKLVTQHRAARRIHSSPTTTSSTAGARHGDSSPSSAAGSCSTSSRRTARTTTASSASGSTCTRTRNHRCKSLEWKN